MHHTWGMGRVRRVVGWVFVRGPAAAYALADSGSSVAGFAGILGMLLVAGAGPGLGVLSGAGYLVGRLRSSGRRAG